jgi:hypothetical protein
MYTQLTQPYLVVSHCDTMEKNVKKCGKKNSKSDAHSTEIYLYIPAILRYGYGVWSGYAKYTTVGFGDMTLSAIFLRCCGGGVCSRPGSSTASPELVGSVNPEGRGCWWFGCQWLRCSLLLSRHWSSHCSSVLFAHHS